MSLKKSQKASKKIPPRAVKKASVHPASKKPSHDNIRKSSKNSKTSSAKRSSSKSVSTKRASGIQHRTTRMEPKKVLFITRSRWYVVSSLVILMTLMVTSLSLAFYPLLSGESQASILAQMGGQDVVSGQAKSQGGVLLTVEDQGQNENKLRDIFQTIFPEMSVREIPYDSPQGQDLIQQLGITEVPNILFQEGVFEEQQLSAVVQDLFSLQQGYYVLNVSFVNPSDQLWIGGAPYAEGGIAIGQSTAPVTILWYSDLRCQQCRANERNNLPSLLPLVNEGVVQIIFLDLPSGEESQFHSAALACFARVKQDQQQYVQLRQNLFNRTNLSQAYTSRQLEDAGISWENDCDQAALGDVFRQRSEMAEKEGVSSLPTLYVGRSGSGQYHRLTGVQKFSVIQKMMDELMGSL
ncbi:MAG: thioredoxin domain-containing protein [bacterium]|nr:thioredoxin domain-containing protein [bacterium]